MFWSQSTTLFCFDVAYLIMFWLQLFVFLGLAFLHVPVFWNIFTTIAVDHVIVLVIYVNFINKDMILSALDVDIGFFF